MDYNKFCERCQHFQLSLQIGIVCGLIKAKPNFKDSCNDFVIDKK